MLFCITAYAEDLPVQRRNEVGGTFHHYAIVHWGLTNYYKKDPIRFFKIINSKQKMADSDRTIQRDLINAVYEGARKVFDKEGEPYFSADDIKTESIKVVLGDKRFAVVLVTMPEPRFVPEAYMVAVILHIKEGKETVEFFTLEKSFGCTMLCGWSQDGNHLNFGKGPEPDADKFIEASLKKIN